MADLVVCCDGTWNTPDDLEGGLPAPTNVVKIYNALAAEDATGAPIERYYHPGVGTDGGWWDRALGGGVGSGLSGNVKSAYRWLASHYSLGDRIWLFGFSRGAFTVRSLSGAITRCGLLDPSGKNEKDTWASVDAIYADYRARTDGLKATKTRLLHNVDIGGDARLSTKIHFIGVWDTVGALGIPDDMGLLKLLDKPQDYRFHDTDLSDAVIHARHAVAIDERRQSFTPTLWSDTPPKQNLKQIWFPGVHADVGGGYGRAGLSDGALKWMMEEARDAAEDGASGLAFRAEAWPQLSPDPRGVLHDSLTGVFKELKARPREVPCFDPTLLPTTGIHASAIDRSKNPPLNQLRYWATAVLKETGDSQAVDVFASERLNATGLYLQSGVAYDLKATGEWKDRSISCPPKGMKDGKFEIGEAVHVVLSGWGKVESLFQRATGNIHADFWYTLREPKFPWFSLVGMIASGQTFDAEGALLQRPLDQTKADQGILNETILIGDGATFTPKASGYLYCFANDTWQTYGNNKGSVRLTVTRR